MQQVKAFFTLAAAGAFVAGLALTVPSSEAQATPAIAQQSGKGCVTCHANPSGGGKLKKAGEDWKAGKR